MGVDDAPRNMQNTLSKHAFFDLSHVSPLVFLFLLKSCYAYGTRKASDKFHVLQQQIYVVLHLNHQAGPSTLIVRCLYILPILESYCGGFSHLILAALHRFLKITSNAEDQLNAQICAAKLFLEIIGGNISHDEAILRKIVQVFDVKLPDIDKVMAALSVKRILKAETSKEVVEQYVFDLIERQSYMTAVDLLIHFEMNQFEVSFLLRLMECQQFKAAEKLATYMGKSSLCLLVQEYADQNVLNLAYGIIKKNNLQQDFPELYYQYKESSLKRLAEKGVWDTAEARAKGDKQLLEYLVYLAMEAGYFEKVKEICDRYALQGFLNFKETESDPYSRRYLNLQDLSVENIFWVDEVNCLRDAIHFLRDCKIVGLDCEWKPNYEKGRKPSKVSIMQIASEKKVYIVDLMKLYEDVPTILDECLARILHSPSILKLGYNFQCDIKQLAHSYGELNCFKHFEMLLDIQNVFREPRGGLSGLAEKILGTGLNKTRRNSNWELRPLSHYQLEYAALDAVVLLHILRVGCQSHPAGTKDGHGHGHTKIEWKSHIISHIGNTRTPKKEGKTEE